MSPLVQFFTGIKGTDSVSPHVIVVLTTVCICSTTALVSYLYGKYHLNKYHKIRDQIEPFLWKIQNMTFLFFWCLKCKHNCKSPIYNGVPLNPLSDQLCGRYYPFIWSIMWKILSLYLINYVEDIISLSDQLCGRYYPFIWSIMWKILSLYLINDVEDIIPLSDQLCGRYYPFIWSTLWKILSLYLINDVEDIIPLSDQWCGRYYPFVEKPQLKIISFKIINLAILFILNLTKLLRLHCHLFSSKQ